MLNPYFFIINMPRNTHDVILGKPIFNCPSVIEIHSNKNNAWWLCGRLNKEKRR